MKLLGKKGIEKESLVLLIFVAAVLIFSITVILKGSAEASESSAEVAACKGSVLRNAQLRISGIEFPTDIHCPTRNVLISDDDTKSPDKAKSLIAKEMYYCWDQYGEGKLNLFRDEATFCAVCSFISIDSEAPVTGLLGYLLTEQLPDRSGRLYYGYLSGFTTDKAKSVLGDALKNPELLTAATGIELEKGDYAIVFVYAKGKDELEKLKRHLSSETFAGQAGFVAGVGGGALAAGGTMMALTTIGVVAGPPGWVVLGAGAAAFGVVYGMSEGISFIFSPDNVPEWASFIVLRPWNEKETANILQNDLGCEYFPVPLE